MIEHRHIEPLTAEEDTEARLQSLVNQDYAILRALKSQGARITSRCGYDYVVLNPEAIGLEPPAVDDEHPGLSLPRILRNGVFLPLEDRTLTPLEVCDRFMKTPKKRREFALGCTREPTLPVSTAIKAGAEYDRVAVATAATAERAEKAALGEAGVKPGETVKAVLVECRDEALAAEIVETKRDSLPWATVEVRNDGELPADWHGCRLKWDEKARLKDQAGRDRRAKRERRDKLLRQMQREPI